MRRVLVGLLVLASMGVAARRADAQEGSVGVKAGPTMATAKSASFDTESDAGAGGGVFITWNVSDVVRIQPEVLLTRRRFTVVNVPGSAGVTSNAIEVPLLIQAAVAQSARSRLLLFAGPQLGRIGSVTQRSEGRETDLDDQLKDFDFGAVFGGGVEHTAGRGAFVIDARFVLGLRDLNDTRLVVVDRRIHGSAGARFDHRRKRNGRTWASRSRHPGRHRRAVSTRSRAHERSRSGSRTAANHVGRCGRESDPKYV